MKVYYEVIYCLNFLLDFMILFGTKRILKRKTSYYRLILGSLVGSFSIVLLFIKMSSFHLLFFKLCFSFIMIFISFGFSSVWTNLGVFYMISFLLGGFFYGIDLSFHPLSSYLFLIMGSISMISIIIFSFLKYKEIIPNKYMVFITIRKKTYQLEGLLDTGNQLISPYHGESIILVNLNISSKKWIYVPYKALNTSGVVCCIRPDKVLVNKQEIPHCLIGIAKEKFSLGGVQCILPNSIKERLC